LNKTYEVKEVGGIKYHMIALPGTDIFKLTFYNRAGSDYEKYYSNLIGKKLFGISHLIEHMSFKSTAQFDTDELQKMLRKYGQHNAGTYYDYINYWYKTTSEHTDKAIDIVIDIALNDLSLVTEEEFENEKKTVISEVQQYIDNKELWFKLTHRGQFMCSDMDDNIIGTPETLKEITLNDVRAIKKLMCADTSKRAVAIVYDPEVNKPDFLVSKVKSAIDALDYANKFDVDNRILPPLEPTLTSNDIEIPVDIDQELLSVLYPTDSGFTARFIGNQYLEKLAHDKSLFHTIREENGYSYGVSLSKSRLKQKDYTELYVNCRPETRGKVLTLAHETILNAINTFTRDDYQELVDTITLKDKIAHMNLGLYENIYAVGMYYPDDFKIVEDVFKTDISRYYEVEILHYGRYEDVVAYFENLKHVIENKEYKVIINK